jgi:hypothetical protein
MLAEAENTIFLILDKEFTTINNGNSQRSLFLLWFLKPQLPQRDAKRPGEGQEW